jgi:hypothetical protein
LAVTVISLLASGIALGDPGRKKQAFLPLARADISVPFDRAAAFSQAITDFSNARKLRLDRGDFPKDGRIVMNMKISLTHESFFIANNFINSNSFELIAYSHEDAELWRPVWSELIARITKEFGEPRTIKP